MALLSWWSGFHPPLPLLSKPPTYPDRPKKSHYSFGKAHPVIGTKGDLDSSASRARETLAEHHAQTELSSDDQDMEKQNEIWDNDNQGEAERVNNDLSTSEAISRHLSESHSGGFI